MPPPRQPPPREQLQFTLWCSWGPPVRLGPSSHSGGGSKDEHQSFPDPSTDEIARSLARAVVGENVDFDDDSIARIVCHVDVEPGKRGAHALLYHRRDFETLVQLKNVPLLLTKRANSTAEPPKSPKRGSTMLARPAVAFAASAVGRARLRAEEVVRAREAAVPGGTAVPALKQQKTAGASLPPASPSSGGSASASSSSPSVAATTTWIRRGGLQVRVFETGIASRTHLVPGESYSWKVVVHNEGRDTKLDDVIFVDQPEFRVSGLPRRGGVLLATGERFSLNIDFRARSYGVFRLHMLLRFTSGIEGYVLVGPVSCAEPADAGDSAEGHRGEADRRRKQRRPRFDENIRIIPAEPPTSLFKSHRHTGTKTRWVVRLGEYPIPDKIQDDIDEHSHSLDTSGVAWLLKDNYKSRLHHLLWVEEAEHRKGMRQYDLKDTEIPPQPYVELPHGGGIKQMEGGRPFARLHVPGLAENRPSVLYADSVYAFREEDPDTHFEGWVYRSERDHLLLVFFPAFFDTVGKVEAGVPPPRFSVRFQPNRQQFRVVHRAIELCDVDSIWPTAGMKPLPKPQVTAGGPDLPWFDDRLDAQQKSMIVKIARTPPAVPYLLFGPFGCGKTRALVELARQIARNVRVKKREQESGDTTEFEESALLIAAPSNSAADMMCALLSAEFTPSEMFRLNAFNRVSQSVRPMVVLDYCKYNADVGIFDLPPVEELKRFRLILTTCGSASLLTSVGVEPGHFSHIIIDEAAQLTESDTLVPLCLAKSGRTCIVMAGDDRQFGPLVLSDSARHHGLHHSMMERLARQSGDVYHTRRGTLRKSDTRISQWGSTVPDSDQRGPSTHLSTNYRVGDAQLVLLQSKLFYGGVLSPSLDTQKGSSPRAQLSSQLCSWGELGNKTVPLLVCGVEGTDEQEPNSPSFFNPLEASEIARLISNLLQTFSQHRGIISGSDIGVVTPYRAQVSHLRDVLGRRGVRGVKVGTPREWQGHERAVLFVSSVRSMWRRHDLLDRRFHLGVVNDAKQMCTILSRASALLVVVGDPYNLVRDWRWKALIDFARRQNAYRGPQLTGDYLKLRSAKDEPDGKSSLTVVGDMAYAGEESLSPFDFGTDASTSEGQQQLTRDSAVGDAAPRNRDREVFPPLSAAGTSAQTSSRFFASENDKSSGSVANPAALHDSSTGELASVSVWSDALDNNAHSEAGTTEASVLSKKKDSVLVDGPGSLSASKVLVSLDKIGPVVSVMPPEAAEKLHILAAVSNGNSLEIRISLFGLHAVPEITRSRDSATVLTVALSAVLPSSADASATESRKVVTWQHTLSSIPIPAVLFAHFSDADFDTRSVDVSVGTFQLSVSVPLRRMKRDAEEFVPG
jgi:DNA polymerase III delta prime subunit